MPWNRKLLKGTVFVSFNLLAGQVVALLYSIMGTRLFSPVDYGRIMAVVAMSMIVATISDFGFAQEALRKQVINSTHQFPVSKRKIRKLIVLELIAVTVMWSVDFHLAYLAIPLIGLAWYLSVLAAIPYRAHSNFIRLSIYSSAGRVCGLVLVIALLTINNSEVFFIIGFSLIYFLDALSLLVLGRKSYPLALRDAQQFEFRNSVVGVLPVIQNLDVIAIRLASPLDAGIFSAVNKWPAALGSLVTAINVANFNSHILPSTIKRSWRLDLMPYFLLVFLVSTITLIYSRSMVNVVLPPEYSGSLNTFRILVLVSLISFWNQAYFSRFIAKGFHSQLIYIYTFWTSIQIAALYFITKHFTLEYALISLLTAQILMLLSFINSERVIK